MFILNILTDLQVASKSLNPDQSVNDRAVGLGFHISI